MRVFYGRGDWQPGVRIEGLLRYAFIGDSFAYGAGVAADETLSANAERQINELLPEWPVEAVNLGVSGFNLWNDWLNFETVPQVYEGVVLVLCNNDAEFFGRAFGIAYPMPHETRWKAAHPFGRQVARCFDRIAEFSKRQSTPVAVVYYNTHEIASQIRISEILGEHCAARGLCFIDTLAHYRERKFTPAEMLVSWANHHPSAKAHEAVGRHLVATLRRRGWFDKFGGSEIAGAPARISAAARAMVETDHYPADAALNWARSALDAKERLAQRMEALGSDDSFGGAAEPVSKWLDAGLRRWHGASRLRAFALSTAAEGSGIAAVLNAMNEEVLKLDEVGFALESGSWSELAACGLDTLPKLKETPKNQPPDLREVFAGFDADYLRIQPSLEAIGTIADSDAPEWYGEQASMRADRKALEVLAFRAETGCTGLKAAFQRIEDAFQQARPGLPEESLAQVSNIIGGSRLRIRSAFGIVNQWVGALQRMQDRHHATFTSVDVTVRGGPVEGGPRCIVTGRAEYSVPYRLPFFSADYFIPDGSSALVKLSFPLFCGARLYLWTNVPKMENPPVVEISLVKIEVYNRPNERRTIVPAAFHKDGEGRFVSPPIYLY